GGGGRWLGGDGRPLGGLPCLKPIRVAVDSASDEGWVASVASGYVWLLSPALVAIDSLRFRAPFGIALDWRRRTAWIVDPVTGELLAVNMDTRTVRFRIGRLGAPRRLALDLSSGDASVRGAALRSPRRRAPRAPPPPPGAPRRDPPRPRRAVTGTAEVGCRTDPSALHDVST